MAPHTALRPPGPIPASGHRRMLEALVQGVVLRSRGFRPPSSWYVNDAANLVYAGEAPDEGRLSMPVLIINGDYDQICTIAGNNKAT